MGITGNFYNLIKHMYSSTKIKLRLAQGLSGKFSGNTGIKQGDGLSPLLFNIFINDLNYIFDKTCDPVNLSEMQISNMLYADDLLIISKSQAGLQRCVDKLSLYCHKWHLNINMVKTKTMVISSSGKMPKSFTINLNNQPIEQTKTYKYLGLNIHNNGNFKKGTANLKQKALKAWFKCRSILNSNKINNTELYLQLFDKLVKPILMYGCEVWGPDYMRQLNTKNNIQTIDNCFCEMVHNKACKTILGIKKNSSNVASRAE